MTQITNLPSLTTLTNNLFFIAADASDNNVTKKIHLNQLVALSAGPRGVIGPVGPMGPAGPSGPVGPSANQSLNTNSNVVFAAMTVTNLYFIDGTVQSTAYKKTALDLSDLSAGDVTLSANQITSSMLTGNPPANRNLYLPAASAGLS